MKKKRERESGVLLKLLILLILAEDNPSEDVCNKGFGFEDMLREERRRITMVETSLGIKSKER